MLTRSRRALLFASALLLVATACSSSATDHAADLTKAAVPAAAAKISHVFVINLENEDFVNSWGPTSTAKYLNGTLRKQGELLTHYYGSATSASTTTSRRSVVRRRTKTRTSTASTTCRSSDRHERLRPADGTGCVFPIGEDDRRPAERRREDLEGLPGRHRELDDGAQDVPAPAARRPDPTIIATKTDMYATRHDPWVYFHSIIDSPRRARECRRSQRAHDGSFVGREDTEPLVHHAERLRRRSRHAVQGRSSGRV